MILKERIEYLEELGRLIKTNDERWVAAKRQAAAKNQWFTPDFIQHAADRIAEEFLEPAKLGTWISHYHLDDNIRPKKIGVIPAGNIPMSGFHDILAVFVSGHTAFVKLSERDDVLLRMMFNASLIEMPGVREHVKFNEPLKNADAYIATGSDLTARSFREYFGKYPNIIRKNRTSVAVLSGNETAEELDALSDDIHMYFGSGCRSVTKLYVPKNYDFVPLLNAFKKYAALADHARYRNNYDYQLAVLLLNKQFYMTDGTTLLSENEGLSSPIAHVWYEHYESGGNGGNGGNGGDDGNGGDGGNGENGGYGGNGGNAMFANIRRLDVLIHDLKKDDRIQCLHLPGERFGKNQSPGLFDYADGVDVMKFLLGL